MSPGSGGAGSSHSLDTRGCPGRLAADARQLKSRPLPVAKSRKVASNEEMPMVTCKARRAVAGAMAGVCFGLAVGGRSRRCAGRLSDAPDRVHRAVGTGRWRRSGRPQVRRHAGAAAQGVVSGHQRRGRFGTDRPHEDAGRRARRLHDLDHDRRHVRHAGRRQAELEILRHHAGRDHDQAAVGVLRADGKSDQDVERSRGGGEEAAAEGRDHGFRHAGRHHGQLLHQEGRQPRVGTVRQSRASATPRFSAVMPTSCTSSWAT